MNRTKALRIIWRLVPLLVIGAILSLLTAWGGVYWSNLGRVEYLEVGEQPNMTDCRLMWRRPAATRIITFQYYDNVLGTSLAELLDEWWRKHKAGLSEDKRIRGQYGMPPELNAAYDRHSDLVFQTYVFGALAQVNRATDRVGFEMPRWHRESPGYVESDEAYYLMQIEDAGGWPFLSMSARLHVAPFAVALPH